MQIKIKSRTYSIEKTEERPNVHGQLVRYTDLKGSRGADVTLIESSTSATLIHFGRSNPSEKICLEDITRI